MKQAHLTRTSGFWSSAAGFLGVLLVVALISLLLFAFRVVLFKTYHSAADSMAPTLLSGDYFFVSRYEYQFGFLTAEPQRGDVVVFRLPRDPSIEYVKRIVGLPGDGIQMREGALYINGKAVERKQIEPFLDDDSNRIKRWRETLANGVSYDTLDVYAAGLLDNTGTYAVPDGHYFMMGDNRDNTTDSRVPANQGGGVGYVPLENITGRARMIYFSVNPRRASGGPVRFGRIGAVIR
jgi:signal peptidase I